MPTRPNRLCLEPGCHRLVKMGRCPEHAHKTKQHYATERETSNPNHRAYYTEEWRRIRAAHLAAEPNCRRCGKPGNVVDHITPWKGDMSAFYAGPFQTLCRPCHASKTAKHDGWRAKSLSGY